MKGWHFVGFFFFNIYYWFIETNNIGNIVKD